MGWIFILSGFVWFLWFLLVWVRTWLPAVQTGHAERFLEALQLLRPL